MKLKLSRPVLYIGLAAIIGTGVYIYTEPAPVAKKIVAKKSSLRQLAGIPGILPEDYERRFARVSPSERDVFRPLISRTTSERAPNNGGGFGSGGWHLTGISIVNGQRFATVESSNGDLASLKLGQSFDGYVVRSITDADVTMESQDGKREKLRFIDTTVVEVDTLRTNTNLGSSVSTLNTRNIQPPASAAGPGNTNIDLRQRNRNQGN